MMKLKLLAIAIAVLLFSSCFSAFVFGDLGTGSFIFATNASTPSPPPPPSNSTAYTINQTLSDGAQRDTIAFDGLAFLIGNLGGQSFLPPGKVADLSGFQYLRDNDPTNMGHNTDFVTRIAFNVLHILTSNQVNQLIDRAKSEVALINEYAYERFPLMEAFRRLLEGNLPQGSTGLDKQAVMNYTAELGQINGQILYDKAQLLGGILRLLTTEQKNSFQALKSLNGVGNWNKNLTDPLKGLNLGHDVNVAVMTYASEMYSWYAGSVEADTYFCPEGEGTYFGSFYLKDWPAMGNPNYTIDEQLTARAGEDFLKVLTSSQAEMVTSLVDIQKSDLYGIVQARSDLATVLRGFLTGNSVNNTTVMNLARRYGELDGEIVYYYATHFAELSKTLNTTQKIQLEELVDALGYVPCTGAFLYSSPISMPSIMNTDFLFSTGTSVDQYSVAIVSHCNTEGLDVGVAVTKNGSPSGFSTPHTFSGLTGSHNFTVPNVDANGHAFRMWSTGSTSTTIAVSSGGTYTAYYGDGQGSVVYMNPSSSKVAVGHTMIVAVNIVNVINLYSWQMKLYFNSSSVNCTGAWYPDYQIFAGKPFASVAPSMGQNYVGFGASLVGDLRFNGSGTLCLINFTGLSIGNCSLQFDVEGTFLLDSDLNSIHVTINKGLLTVVNALSTDINGDGKVDIIDIATVARGFGSTSGTPNWNPIADVNGDGKVDIVDIATVAIEFKV